MKGKGMRRKGRKQGRFVSLSGLKKLASPPGSSYPLLIVDATGLPVFPLCEWYRHKKTDDAGRTPDTYFEMLQPYFGFLILKKYAWNDPPDRVRAYLVEFLRNDVGCHVGPAQQDGYLVETTGASPLSKSSLGVLLAALTSLYDILADAGYYGYPNPMRSERLTALKQEHLRQVENVGAPDHAGIRGESHQETKQAYPTAFFRQKRGKVWAPEVIMEPEAVQERMRESIDFMIEHASFRRDKVILLLLRQTGARLSEIIEMTAGGYRNAHHMGRAYVRNKGSRGREEKLIYFTEVIEEQLHGYVRAERAEYDPQRRKRLDQLADEEPLFLTEDGHPYNRSAFYYHWAKLFEVAQKRFKKQERVTFSPHDIRHLRVTRGIAKIKHDAKGDKVLEEELLDGFWRLMGWHSSQTMETYTHTMNARKALLEVMLAEEDRPGRSEPQNEGPPGHFGGLQPETRQALLAHASPLDDEFSWYEEE
jgi:Phage integrase family